MERFSMNEFKPLDLMEKKLRLEDNINKYEIGRQQLTDRITEICGELSEYNSIVRGNQIEESRYQSICKAQVELKKEKVSLENRLSPIKQELRKLNHERDTLSLNMKRIPDGKAKQKMLEIRDKYMSFAADTTRVSSMRAMASRFIEEIQIILTEMP